ncbi:MAG: hypothetical protein QM677_04945, partial [Microbacterium sp.]
MTKAGTLAAFKGFDEGLQCRGFQYEVGKTYTHDGPVSLCAAGFHAVELPLDAMSYYSPIGSRYHHVTLGDVADERSGDSKCVGGQITVGESISVAGLIEAHIGAIRDNVAATTGDYAHAATTGDHAHAATTGDCAHAATTGDCAHAATTGGCAHAATTGDCAHAATTGGCAHAATTGGCAHAATTGGCAHAATTGDHAHAATTG